MSAAVTPLEARCAVCLDTGSKSKDMEGDIDCTACNAATERMALREKMAPFTAYPQHDKATWRAYQLGKAAALAAAPVDEKEGCDDSLLLCVSDMEHSAIYDSPREMVECMRAIAKRLKALAAHAANVTAAAPVVPVAAQPVVQVPETVLKRTDEIRLTMANPTGIGRATLIGYVECLLAHIALTNAAPSLEAQPAGEVVRAGMLKAADIIGEKANDYLNEFATTEHDTGAVVFLYGQDGCDYYTSLVELSEEIRSIAMAQGEKQ